jgi:hypothetical protein
LTARIPGLLLGLSAASASLVAQAPPGWRGVPDTQVGLDTNITHTGHGSAVVRGESPADVAVLRQAIRADSFLGQRVRLSAYVRTNLVAGTAGLWMRIDGAGPTEVLAFDNMNARPIQGTTPWTSYSIVLDVSRTSTSIVLGALVEGQGRLWLDDVLLESVGPDVPSTNMTEALEQVRPEDFTPQDVERILAARRTAPMRLRNTDFEQRRNP